MIVDGTHPWIAKYIRHCRKMRARSQDGSRYRYVEMYRELSRMDGEWYVGNHDKEGKRYEPTSSR
jgi:hypothetical protein